MGFLKRFSVALILILLCSVSHADQFIVPFSVYPKELQKTFAEEGYKLDLSGNDRTRDSWGFIQSEGSQYKIFTYEPIKDDEFPIFLGIVMKHVRGQ